MVESTMAQDIETASYYELVAWCRLLGLDEAGDKPALVQRLKDFFKVKTEAEKKEVLRRIDIKSARSSEYFTLEDVKEDYVLIQGGVTIVLTDKKDNSQHTIQAERVLYNQTTGTISASGDVVYKRKIGDKEEAFTGQTFVFDVSNWEGVLYYGAGERSQKIDDVNVMFRYSGETITRLKDQSILLEKGVITSSANLENPNYRIKADRIWVYSPGEWSVQNAVLYLGNIPVLYLPFYYYTSDELFFNPVFGFKIREGAFWQNTIYLMGKKEREQGALDFLQMEQSSDQDVEMQLHGLFLHQARKPTSPSGAAGPEAAQKAAAVKHLKLFLDLYSRLGVFAGVSFDATPAFSLKGGIGITRSIFTFQSNVYTVYYEGNDYWNSGYLFGLKTPVRYGLETQFKTSLGLIERIEGGISYFSDPVFPVDFYDREENQDWGKIVGFEIPSTTAAATATATNTLRTTLSWNLNLAFNFAGLLQSPLFQQLRIDPFNFTFEWWSKTLTTSDPIVAADPARMFYFPYRIIFPNVTLAAGGTIYEYTLSNQVAAPKTGSTAAVPPAAPGGANLVPPADLAPSGPASQAPPSDAFGLRAPDLKPDATVNRTMKYFSLRLYYTLNQQFRAEHLFSADNWNTVEDITYYTKNSAFDYNSTTTLNYELTFWECLKIAGYFSLAPKYKVTFIPYQGFAQADADKLSTALDFFKYLQVVYNPFKAFPDFQASEISYNLKWDFYKIVYSAPAVDYLTSPFLFNQTTVSQQQVIANLVYQPEDKMNYLKLTANIPPYLGSFKSELGFFLWIFQTTAKAEYNQATDGSWSFGTLTITELANLGDVFALSTTFNHNLNTNSPIDLGGTVSLLNYQYLNASHYLVAQDLKYNFGASALDLARTTVDLWNLKAVILAERIMPLSPLGYQTGSVPQFVFHSFDLSYSLNLPEVYAWKNRIAFSTAVGADLLLDFQKLINSKFTLHLEFVLKVSKFIDLSFSVDVYNNNVYRYIPGFVDQVNADLASQGIPVVISPVDPFTDLLRSFNFFNIEDRYNSFFKLKALSFNITHYLDDWVLKVGFTGSFQYKTYSDGTQSYEWTPAFTFSLKWLGIPELKKEFTGDAYGFHGL
jgi:hypothetical protein